MERIGVARIEPNVVLYCEIYKSYYFGLLTNKKLGSFCDCYLSLRLAT